MKHWGTLILVSVLAMAAYVGGVALAEPEAETPTGMAMPMQVPDDGGKIAGVQRNMPSSRQKVMNAIDEEKARLSVDMDQTAEKLEAKIYELKTVSLHTKGPKKRFLLHQKIKKLEGQKSSLTKMHHKVSKTNNGSLGNAKQNWDKLKVNIDKQLGISE